MISLVTCLIEFSAEMKKKFCMGILVRVSIAVKRHLIHGSSYKEKTFNCGGLHFQRFIPLSSWCDTVMYRQTCPGEGAEDPIS